MFKLRTVGGVWLAFGIVGSLGCLAGAAYGLWARVEPFGLVALLVLAILFAGAAFFGRELFGERDDQRLQTGYLGATAVVLIIGSCYMLLFLGDVGNLYPIGWAILIVTLLTALVAAYTLVTFSVISRHNG